jgi:hypothetical protein
MAEKVENQIKSIGSSPLNAFLPRFLQNMDCLLCFGNNGIQQTDDSGRDILILKIYQTRGDCSFC